jgi:Rieske Fe-S protein
MRMQGEHRTHRRTLIRTALGAVVALPALGLLGAMVRRLHERETPTQVHLPGDLPTGLSVRDGILLYRPEGGQVKAFVARCSHLGCLIDRVVGEEAVCPCHGSRFRADGSVAQGPASRPLQPLLLEPDPATGGWIARVPA